MDYGGYKFLKIGSGGVPGVAAEPHGVGDSGELPRISNDSWYTSEVISGSPGVHREISEFSKLLACGRNPILPSSTLSILMILRLSSCYCYPVV